MENAQNGSNWRTSGKLLLLYTQSYFISVATVLGSGILGLPATLSQSGFYPFLVTFIINYIIQVLSIYQMMEVLQYARAISKSAQVTYSKIPEMESLINDEAETQEASNMENDGHNWSLGTGNAVSTGTMYETELEKTLSDELSLDASNDLKDKNAEVDSNFHVLGKLFLPKCMQPIYLIVIFLQFAIITISYSLAGSEAYAQLFGVSTLTMTPYFTWILGLIVIFGHEIIKPGIAVMTFVKGSLLFATVVVTLYSGAAINQEITNDWAYTDKPLLMGIVSLSGLILVMPMLFEKFQSQRNQMLGFRNAVIGGLTTCFLLNIMWCWAVLKIVPQTAAHCNATVSSSNQATCDPTLTLEQADLNGVISTVPLTKIMLSRYSYMGWIAVAIQVFILISITVSFLTVASAMQHSASGWIDAFLEQHERWKISINSCSPVKENFVWHVFIGLICFSTIFVVAILNPKGFIVIMERFSTLGTNIIYGIFIFMWIRALRSHIYSGVEVSLRTSTVLWYSHYLTLIYYSAATLYDVISWAIGR